MELYELKSEKGNMFSKLLEGSTKSQPSTRGTKQQLGVLFAAYREYTEYGIHTLFPRKNFSYQAYTVVLIFFFYL